MVADLFQTPCMNLNMLIELFWLMLFHCMILHSAVCVYYTTVCLVARKHETMVTAELMNSVLGNVLKLIKNNISVQDAPWMNRIASKSLDTVVPACLSGPSQQRPPSLIMPQIFVATTINVLTSPSHQRPPLYFGHSFLANSMIGWPY